MTALTDSAALRPSLFSDGELLRITRGEFRGATVRVSGEYSFWTRECFYEGDPTKGLLSPEGWQIVVDVEQVDGSWLYLLRADEKELLRFVERIAPKTEEVDPGERADFERRLDEALRSLDATWPGSSEFGLVYYSAPGADPDPTPYEVEDLLHLVLQAEEEGTGSIVRDDVGEIVFDAGNPDFYGGSFCAPWVSQALGYEVASTIVNVTIVTREGSAIQTQRRSFREAVDFVLREADSEIEKTILRRLGDDSPVYLRNVAVPSSSLEAHTVGSIRADREGGRI